MKRLLLVVALVAALVATLAAAPASGLAQKTKAAKPITGPKAIEAALRKLPADAGFVAAFDLAAIRAIPALAEMADELFPIDSGEGPLGEVVGTLFKSVDVFAIGGGEEPSSGVLLGRFKDLRSPLLQAGFKAAARSTGTHRGVTIYEFESDSFGVQAVVDDTTWVLGSSVDDVKKIIDRALDRGRSAFDTAEVKDVLKRLGKPGYLFAAGTSDALEDEDDPELEGFLYGGVSWAKKSNSTTAASMYWRFDSAVNAGKGAAQLKDRDILGKITDLSEITKPKVKQQKNVVLVSFTVPHSSVRANFEED